MSQVVTIQKSISRRCGVEKWTASLESQHWPLAQQPRKRPCPSTTEVDNNQGDQIALSQWYWKEQRVIWNQDDKESDSEEQNIYEKPKSRYASWTLSVSSLRPAISSRHWITQYLSDDNRSTHLIEYWEQLRLIELVRRMSLAVNRGDI